MDTEEVIGAVLRATAIFEETNEIPQIIALTTIGRNATLVVEVADTKSIRRSERSTASRCTLRMVSTTSSRHGTGTFSVTRLAWTTLVTRDLPEATIAATEPAAEMEQQQCESPAIRKAAETIVDRTATGIGETRSGKREYRYHIGHI